MELSPRRRVDGRAARRRRDHVSAERRSSRRARRRYRRGDLGARAACAERAGARNRVCRAGPDARREGVESRRLVLAGRCRSCAEDLVHERLAPRRARCGDRRAGRGLRRGRRRRYRRAVRRRAGDLSSRCDSRRRRRRAAARRSGQLARVRRADRSEAVGILDGAAAGRAFQRDVARRELGAALGYEYVGVLGAGRYRARPRLFADLEPVAELLRRRSSRRERIRQLDRRARCADGRVCLAFPGGAPRYLGCRYAFGLRAVRFRARGRAALPGEWYSPTLPFPVRPEPLSRVSFDPEHDLVRPADTTREHAAACRVLLECSGGLHNEGPFTPFLYKAKGAPPRSTIQLPGGTGGVNWGGVAYDPVSGLAFVNAHDTSLIGWIEDRDPEGNYGRGTQASTQPYDRASIFGPGPYASFNAPIGGEFDEHGRPVGPT